MSDNLCWICQQSYYRLPGEWAKSGYVQSKLCQWCYGDLLKKVVRQKKRARLKGAEATLTTAQWVSLLHDSHGFCHYCDTFIGYKSLTMEHLLPIAKGGGTTAYNCVPACMACNSEQWRKEVRDAS